MLFFEGIGPLIEVAGYLFMVFAAVGGLISWQACAIFLMLALWLGLLLSASGLLLEQLHFNAYPKTSQLLGLILGLLGENLGYRQLNSWWRLRGLWHWMRGARGNWGKMRRKGSWQRT
jgi:hypothetical protein